MLILNHIQVLFNIGVSTGNIIGPLMFSADNAPSYLPGLRACVGIFVAMVAIVSSLVGITHSSALPLLILTSLIMASGTRAMDPAIRHE